MPVGSVYLPFDLAIIAIIGFLVSVSFPSGLIRFLFLAASAFIVGFAISGVTHPAAMDAVGQSLGIDVFASKPWINDAIETSAELLRDYLRPATALALGLALVLALFASIGQVMEYPWRDWARGFAGLSFFAAIGGLLVVAGLVVGGGGDRQQVVFFGKAVAEDTGRVWTFSVVDGDTLRSYNGRLHRQDDSTDIPHKRIRLDGIDAPEADQKCYADGQYTDCGAAAGTFLADLVKEKSLLCARNGTRPDDRDRAIANCWISAGPNEGMDLAREIAAAGYAVPYGDRYQDMVDNARQSGSGIWQGQGCMLEPKLWRDDAAAREAFLATPPVAGAEGIVCAAAPEAESPTEDTGDAA